MSIPRRQGLYLTIDVCLCRRLSSRRRYSPHICPGCCRRTCQRLLLCSGIFRLSLCRAARYCSGLVCRFTCKPSFGFKERRPRRSFRVLPILYAHQQALSQSLYLAIRESRVATVRPLPLLGLSVRARSARPQPRTLLVGGSVKLRPFRRPVVRALMLCARSVGLRLRP